MNQALFSHLNETGEARMVDVAVKEPTRRRALARAEILMNPETLNLLRSKSLKKGDAFTVAKIAGIMAVKKTSDLIPLCHPLTIEHIEIRFTDVAQAGQITIECEVATIAKTGVEMEALTGASVAALTLYDMVKGYDPGTVISHLRLIKKTGGKSDYVA